MLPSISINNTSAAYPESINENNNDEVNGLVQEFKNLFNGKEGISTCIKHLLELIKNCNDPAVPAQLSGFGIGLRRCFHL